MFIYVSWWESCLNIFCCSWWVILLTSNAAHVGIQSHPCHVWDVWWAASQASCWMTKSVTIHINSATVCSLIYTFRNKWLLVFCFVWPLKLCFWTVIVCSDLRIAMFISDPVNVSNALFWNLLIGRFNVSRFNILSEAALFQLIE